MTKTSFIPADGQSPAVGSTVRYSTVLTDENKAPVGSGVVTALTLTLLEPKNRVVVNGVTAVNILNADRGTLDVNGNLVITLTPADTALVEARRLREDRSMVIEWTYSGAKKGRHQFDFPLIALASAHA